MATQAQRASLECGKERGGESLLLVLDVLLLLDIHLLESELRGDQGAGRPREDGHLQKKR